MNMTENLSWREMLAAVALGIAPFAFCWTVLPALCWLLGWL